MNVTIVRDADETEDDEMFNLGLSLRPSDTQPLDHIMLGKRNVNITITDSESAAVSTGQD